VHRLPKKLQKRIKEKHLNFFNSMLRLPPIAMLHQRQKKATCAVQALSNAAGEALLTIDEALAASHRLNERNGTGRHGDAEGNFSIATIQAALQARYGRQYVLRHINKLNERKAPKWLSKQTEGRFMVKNSYNWIAVRSAANRVIDGALKHPYAVRKLTEKSISKIYRLEG
jgi:Josephin